MYTQLFSSAELSVPHSEIHSELSRTEWLSVSAPIHSTQDCLEGKVYTTKSASKTVHIALNLTRRYPFFREIFPFLKIRAVYISNFNLIWKERLASKDESVPIRLVIWANFEKSTRTHQYSLQNLMEMLYGMHRYSRKKN